MKNEISKNDVIGNEISFPVSERKPRVVRLNGRKLFLSFLLGYLVIGAVVMGIRSSFFINARFAEGVVSDINKSPRGYSFDPHVMFTAGDGTQINFIAAQNLRLKIGERVKVIYKINNPQRAAVYSFFGFWFNSILCCQVLVLFWVGMLVAYYGDYP